jgi:hypothetical protein
VAISLFPSTFGRLILYSADDFEDNFAVVKSRGTMSPSSSSSRQAVAA